MSEFNMQKQTITKSSPLSPQSIALLLDKKRELLIIPSDKSIRVYNILSQKLQQQSKIPNQNGPVTCLTLSDDIFFFAHGMHIAASGYNSKVIFNFDTYLAAQKIDRIHVIGWRLWVIAGNMVNLFSLAGGILANKMSRKMASTSSKVQDIQSYMLQSKIMNSYAVEDQFNRHFLILLTSNNQILCYQDKQLCNYKTSSPPTTIIPYPRSATNKNRYLIGTMSGQILHLQISKIKIKQLWKISQSQSKGSINLLVQVKNQSFFVFKDKLIQVWGSDRSIMAAQQTEEKYVSGVYFVQKQILFIGSVGGIVTQMRDYAKMMKDYESKNQARQKQNLLKQIQQLKAQYQILKQKASMQNKTVKTDQHLINAQANISIDYQNLCLSIQIRSELKILKVILKGNISIIKCSKLSFSHVQNQVSTFTVEEQPTKISKILFKFQQKFNTVSISKMNLMVYLQKQGIIYAVPRTLDIKLLCFHHKIPKSETTLADYNELKISGQFKYFQINNYLNMIFWEFGQALAGDVDNQVFYESILTKQKIVILYKNNSCRIYASNPSPLVLIKQFLIQKSKQKHLNYNYSTQLSINSVKNLVNDIAKLIKPLQQTKREAQLLPGLLQIQSSEQKQQLSEDLKQVLSRKQEILQKQKSSIKKYEQLLSQLRQVYISYQQLKQKQVNQYQIDLFNRQLINYFDVEKVINMILS